MAAKKSWLADSGADRASLGQFLSPAELTDIFSEEKEPEAVSDQVRIKLLHWYGGVWVDATTLCMQPLDEWLPPLMGRGFLAFDRPGPTRMLSSWFLAAATSRFHGALAAMRYGAPFIAIDQILGGAKVHDLLSGSGWKHIHRIEHVSVAMLDEAVSELLDADCRSRVLGVRDGCAMETNRTLAHLDQWVASLAMPKFV